MNALRSTDIRDIEDKDDHYHFTFNMYDYKTFVPSSVSHFRSKSKSFEKLIYVYIMVHLEQSEPDFDPEPDFGSLSDWDFYMESCLPLDYNKFHLLIPKTNKKIVRGMDNKQYDYGKYIINSVKSINNL